MALPNPLGFLEWRQWGHAIRPLWNSLRDEQQRIAQVSYRVNGTTAYVRFEPARATLWVQRHVQSTGGGGGGATYNASTYVSSTEVDCRSTRIQDATVTLNGVDQFYIWLIPVWKDPHSGAAYKYDGQGGRPDYMAYVDLGV